MRNPRKLRVRWQSDDSINKSAVASDELNAAILSAQKWFTLSHCRIKGLLNNNEPDCGLCIYHGDEAIGRHRDKYGTCILKLVDQREFSCYNTNSLYQKAATLQKVFRGSKKQKDFKKFQDVAYEMWQLIEKCIVILEKKND